MDAILYIAIFVCLALVAGWYVGNEIRGAKGAWGLLAIREHDAEPAAPRPSYTLKERADIARTRPTFDVAPEAREDQAPRYREAGRGKFRDKDEPSYRSRGPLPTLDKR
jgi:hypothetical protein